MKTRTLLALAAIIAFSSCSLFTKQQKADPILSYAMAEGMVAEVATLSKSEITQGTLEQSTNVATETDVLLTLTFGTGVDGQIPVTVNYSKMNQKMSGPMGDNESDFSQLMGKNVSFKVDAHGECTDFSGLDDLEVFTNALGEEISADILKQGVEQLFFYLPNVPVKIGSTWEQPFSAEFPVEGSKLTTEGKVSFEIVGKSEKQGLPCYQIEMLSTSTTKGSFSQQGMDITMTRSTNNSSTVDFAYTKGIFLGSISSSTSKGEVEITSMNMVIPQEIKTESTTTVTLK